MVRPVALDPVDAVELGELLEFLIGWLDRDGGCLARSFSHFVGVPDYDIDALRADLSRFSFLLGGNDGERLFGGDER